MKIEWAGVICMVGGFIFHLMLGNTYLWGNIQVYVTSYFHRRSPGLSLNDTMIIGPMYSVVSSLFVPVGTLILKYFKPWVAILTASTLCISGAVIGSFMTNFYAFAFFYGFVFGAGVGIGYIVPLSCGWSHFPNRKGMVSGIILCGYGLGGFLFGFISFAVANPHNNSPDTEVDGGKIFGPEDFESTTAPKMLRVNASVWACFAIIALFTVHKKAKKILKGSLKDDSAELLDQTDSHERMQNSPEEEPNSRISNNTSLLLSRVESGETVEDETKYPEFKPALKHYRTWQVAAMVVLAMCQGAYIGYVFKSFGEEKIKDDGFITTVGTIGAVMNGTSRTFWATLMDKIGYKRTMFLILCIQMSIGVTFYFVNASKPLFLIWVALSYFCLGGVVSCAPAVCTVLYGHESGAKVYSIIIWGQVLPGLLGLLVSRTLYKVIGYGAIMFIFAGLTALAFVILLFFNDSPWVEDGEKQVVCDGKEEDE